MRQSLAAVASERLAVAALRPHVMNDPEGQAVRAVMTPKPAVYSLIGR